MKKLLTLLFFMPLFMACSSTPDDPTEDPTGQNPEDKEETVDITNDLCDGSRFIKREFKDYSTPLSGPYKAVMTQREYSFSNDGTGKLVTYVAESTPRGYTQSTTSFSWSATDKKPVSLKVSVEDGESFTLTDVEIAEGKLTSEDEDLSKEMTIDKVLEKSDVKSYSVDMAWSKSTASMPPYMICLEVSPVRLNVKTDDGNVTYITREYGYQAVEIAMPCYQENWGPMEYWDSYIYACVDTESAYYPYSFCDIVAEKEEKPFSEDGKMYFYIGSFSKDTQSFSMIEKNKEYELE